MFGRSFSAMHTDQVRMVAFRRTKITGFQAAGVNDEFLPVRVSIPGVELLGRGCHNLRGFIVKRHRELKSPTWHEEVQCWANRREDLHDSGAEHIAWYSVFGARRTG